MKDIIYEDIDFYVQKENAQIPWLKIFTKEPFKELGDMPKDLRLRLWNIYDIIEFHMKFYYKPKKINMASFANILPRVHIHIMARFEDDSHYPNPIWGEKLRETNLNLPSEKLFFKELNLALTKEFDMVLEDRRKNERRKERNE